ncbi:hypothetical protein LAZ67_2000296 [Cordylochernes scorpioides]|uniref:Uncharacterized protein n=1 Tax=Cordylochernes scorpioides TaxID=51811 RepID=A0ABY6K0D9_9ARAC|nr:hypothetical protein LAZ67_2000296 [Cordylochernes scorpioides]
MEINNLRYADFTILLAENREDLKRLVRRVDHIIFLGSKIDKMGGRLEEVKRRIALGRDSMMELRQDYESRFQSSLP